MPGQILISKDDSHSVMCRKLDDKVGRLNTFVVSAFPLVSKTSPKLRRIPEDSGGLERT